MNRQQIHPTRWLLVCWILWAGLAAAAVGRALAGVYTVMSYPPNRGFLIGFGVAWALGAVAALAHFLTLRYALDEHGLTKASGVLWRHRRSLPLDKITHIDVRQGPIERLLRFGQIWIYTPSSGSDAPEERLIGIRDPHAMKETIVRLAEARLPATAAAAEEERRTLTGLLAEIRDALLRIEAELATHRGKTPADAPLPTAPEDP